MELPVNQINVAAADAGDDAAVQPGCGRDLDRQSPVVRVNGSENAGEIGVVYPRFLADETGSRRGCSTWNTIGPVAVFEAPPEQPTHAAKVLGGGRFRALPGETSDKPVYFGPSNPVDGHITHGFDEADDRHSVLAAGFGGAVAGCGHESTPSVQQRRLGDDRRGSEYQAGIERSQPVAGVCGRFEGSRSKAPTVGPVLLPVDVPAGPARSAAGAVGQPCFSCSAHRNHLGAFREPF